MKGFLHPNTDILTPDGIKKIKDVKIGDRIYSMNIYEEELRTGIDIIKDKIKSSNKELFRFYNERSMGCDIRVTPDNFMIFKSDFRSNSIHYSSASDLLANINRGNAFIKPFNIVHDHDRVPIIRMKGYTNRTYDTNDFLSLLGWYISEGCTRKVRTKIGNMEYDLKVENSIINARYCYCDITQTLENEDYIDDIASLLDRMKIICNYGNNRFIITNSDLANALAYYGGRLAKYKFIHEDIFNFSKIQLRFLFETLNRGDAHIIKGGKGNLYRYKTISINLANDIILLANILGYRTYRSSYYGQYVVNMSNISDMYTQKLKVDIIEYCGDVYNITVDKNHDYFAGNNGKFVLVHDGSCDN